MSDGMERLATGEYARVVESKEGSGMSDIPAQLSEPMTLMRTKDVKHLADRIEELEALRDALGDKVRKLTTLLDDQFGTPCEQIRHKQEVEELEAKLARALEGLREAENAPEPDHHVPQFRHVMDIIGATLAELKGEDRG